MTKKESNPGPPEGVEKPPPPPGPPSVLDKLDVVPRSCNACEAASWFHIAVEEEIPTYEFTHQHRCKINELVDKVNELEDALRTMCLTVKNIMDVIK